MAVQGGRPWTALLFGGSVDKASVTENGSTWTVRIGGSFSVFGLDSYDDAFSVFDCYRNNFIAAIMASSSAQRLFH